MRKKKLIKLIIEVDEKYYEACKDAVEESYPSQIEEVIAHGTVLPEGHGDLIDRDFVVNILEREIYYAENPTIHRTLNYCLGVIDNAPTIIKADKENKECTDTN